jgi:hypothetical protein
MKEDGEATTVSIGMLFVLWNGDRSRTLWTGAAGRHDMKSIRAWRHSEPASAGAIYCAFVAKPQGDGEIIQGCICAPEKVVREIHSHDIHQAFERDAFAIEPALQCALTHAQRPGDVRLGWHAIGTHTPRLEYA